MSRVAATSGVPPRDFLAWEREQRERHEYVRGEVFAMARGTPRHNALCSAVTAALHGAFKGKACVVLSSDQRIGVGAGERYVYADVTVACGGVRIEEGTSDVLENPTVVVEVLSSSTEQYDRGLKWEGYQRLSSLADYVLISQTEPRIEHFRRDADGGWTYRAAAAGGRITLSTGEVLDVDAIFAGAFTLAGE